MSIELNAKRLPEPMHIAQAIARAGQSVYYCDRARGDFEWIALDMGRAASVLSSCSDPRALHALLEGPDAGRRLEWLSRSRSVTPFIGVHRLRSESGGEELWVEERLVREATDGTGGSYGFISDVSERERHREKLLYLACFDELTGHFTRTRLRTALAQKLVSAFRDNRRFCLAYIGLDHMSGINHAFGYDVADDVLRGVGGRIYARLTDNDTLGRVASSKFGIILDDDDPRTVERRLRDIQSDLRENVVTTDYGPVAVTASVGVVILPENARTTQDAFAAAEDALTAAKTQAPCSFSFHVADQRALERRRKNFLAAETLTEALRENRVHLAFQPVVSASAPHRPHFYECLARIFNADGRLIPAMEFMPIAEQLGFVRMIDRQVVHLAFSALRDNETLRLSINVSPLSLFDPAWQEAFRAEAERAGEAATRLIVEITESAAIRDSAAAATLLEEIASYGSLIALDDFGAGYTSFSHFRTMSFDMVKIDGSYVRGIRKSADDAAFVRTLASLAKHFGMIVVAEMVEDDESVGILRSLGIHCLQGYHCGRPEIPEGGAAALHRCEPFDVKGGSGR